MSTIPAGPGNNPERLDVGMLRTSILESWLAAHDPDQRDIAEFQFDAWLDAERMDTLDAVGLERQYGILRLRDGEPIGRPLLVDSCSEIIELNPEPFEGHEIAVVTRWISKTITQAVSPSFEALKAQAIDVGLQRVLNEHTDTTAQPRTDQPD